MTINENYIDEYDVDLLKYNYLFEELIKKYDYEVILKINGILFIILPVIIF